MPDLAQLQSQLAHALNREAAPRSLLQLFAGDGGDVERRLAVYRGNLLATCTQALAAAYPVIAKVVGTQFFEAMARVYRAHAPSASGDLNEYGMQLPEFLEGFAPASELPYLRDLARLEWAVHRAHYGADADAFDVSRLASVPDSEQPALRLKLNPLCRLLESPYPLARIWEIHQKDYDAELSVRFDGGPFYALVCRPRYRVQAAGIGAGEHRFLAATAAGATLSEALDAAVGADAGFALGEPLRRWVEARVVVDFG
jgi:hypothetical protein